MLCHFAPHLSKLRWCILKCQGRINVTESHPHASPSAFPVIIIIPMFVLRSKPKPIIFNSTLAVERKADVKQKEIEKKIILPSLFTYAALPAHKKPTHRCEVQQPPGGRKKNQNKKHFSAFLHPRDRRTTIAWRGMSDACSTNSAHRQRITNCDSMEILLAEVMDLSTSNNVFFEKSFPFNAIFWNWGHQTNATHTVAACEYETVMCT